MAKRRSSNPDSNERQLVIEQLARTCDISAVAEACGLDIVGKGGTAPVTICPFHNDKRPSLRLYPQTSSDSKPHFHCFACNAHGDVFDLVKELRKLTFAESILWLSNFTGITLPSSDLGRGTRGIVPRLSGLERALEIFLRQTPVERRILTDWLTERRLTTEVAKESRLTAARENKLSAACDRDRESLDALREAGLIFQAKDKLGNGQESSVLFERPPRDLFRGNRIVFPINDQIGHIAGFAGRAVGSDVPKYLYSKGFRRSDVLYELDVVRKKLLRNFAKSGSRIAHVFVVEGFVDALRLKSLGLHSVACLGNSLSDGHINLLIQLAAESSATGQLLCIHLFLDWDQAGYRGTIAALQKVLRAAPSDATFLIDVILAPSGIQDGKKVDPDSFLRYATAAEVLGILRECTFSAMSVLLSASMRCVAGELSSVWHRRSRTEQVLALRDVELLFPPKEWTKILERLLPFTTGFDESLNSVAESSDHDWQGSLERFIRHPLSKEVSRTATQSIVVERDDCGKLMHALKLAHSSAQRRELPIDEVSWTRLEIAADVTLPYMIELLRQRSGPQEPFIATYVPKPNGSLRLKALPAPEELILQQYVLVELLREYKDCPSFAETIPAVRFRRHGTKGSVYTSGFDPGDLRDRATVSFAYQIDQDVLEGIIPPRREGIFRPYYECWQAFINHFDQNAFRISSDTLFVARLDISKFYDSLSRSVVLDGILPAVNIAVRQLSMQQLANTFAALLSDEKQTPEDHARGVCDWLCDQSFGYEYYCPRDGSRMRSEWLCGVPQGPDLSAYLANVALFALDRRISDVAHHNAAVYGRYVDDIVIVAPDASSLRVLRGTIEDELAKLGLELNDKSETLDPMTKQEFRYWLTDRRGGFDGSGPFAGPTAAQPLLLADPLADAGDFDRSDALAILHDPAYLHPDTPTDEIQRAVRIARKAADLRHGDTMRAAMLLLHCVTRDSHAERSAEEISAECCRLWIDTSSDELENVPSTIADEGDALFGIISAWLDGVTSYLRSRSDQSPAISENAGRRLRELQCQVASLVEEGLGEKLIDVWKGGNDCRRNFDHLFTLKLLLLRWVAAGLKSIPSSIRKRYQHVPAKITTSAGKRLALSLAEQLHDFQLLGTAATYELTTTPLSERMLFHEAVARLQLASRGTQNPLSPILERLKTQSAITKGPTSLRNSVGCWGDLETIILQCDNAAIERAVNAMINAAGPVANELMIACPHLCKRILKRGDEEIVLLPQPPGVGVSGILGHDRTMNRLVRIDLADPVAFYPDALQWNEEEGRRKHAILLERQLLRPADPSDESSILNRLSAVDRVKWLAHAFRGLASGSQHDGLEKEQLCAVTPFSLFGPNDQDANFESTSFEVFGFLLPRIRVEEQAFIRYGHRSLIAESVPAAYNHLWRIGTALADALDCVHTSQSVHLISLKCNEDASEISNELIAEKILHVALNRLRGKWNPTRTIAEDPNTTWPRTVARVIESLERYASLPEAKNPFSSLALFFAMQIEGHALHVRFDPDLNYGDTAEAGGTTSLLSVIARQAITSDATLAEGLPSLSSLSRDRGPQRRTVDAWWRVSDRIESLTIHAVDDHTKSNLQSLAACTRCVCIEQHLRSVVLELWGSLSQNDRRELFKTNPDLSSFDFNEMWYLSRSHSTEGDPRDSEVLPHDARAMGQPAGSRELFTAIATSSELPNNLYRLLRVIDTATTDGSTRFWGQLDRVTPLGWAVLLACLVEPLQDSPGQIRVLGTRRTLLVNADFSDVTRLFREIVQSLAATVFRDTDTEDRVTVEDVPWGDIAGTISLWDSTRLNRWIGALQQLDALLGISVAQKASPIFSLSGIRKERIELRTDEGVNHINAWQCFSTGASGENTRSGIEATRPLLDGPVNTHWTESRINGSLAGVHFIRPLLAKWAQLGEPIRDVQSGDDAVRVVAPALAEQQQDANAIGDSEKAPPSSVIDKQSAEESEETPARNVENRSTPSGKVAFSEIRDMRLLQSMAWRSRARKLPSHLRVAIAQIDVDDTYRHPLFDACVESNGSNRLLNADSGDRMSIASLKKHPQRWTSSVVDLHGNSLKSCAEYRRRRILREVLDACGQFDVDALLLPEYSLRPETVGWLQTEMKSKAPRTAIWAGTFRLPPQFTFSIGNSICLKDSLGSVRDWASILVLLRGDENPGVRRKKYPAIGMNEIFAPSIGGLDPLFPHVGIDLKRFILELICSEAFIATSPANLLCAAQSLVEITRRFGVKSPKIAIDSVMQDVSDFAERTSVTANVLNRRSVLFVPAMTSRAQDYSVLGQAGYLSAGLTTVFCNAVCGNYGHGSSCFVGHDGWDMSKNEDVGIPQPGPYYGVSPGIYRMKSSKRGCLDKAEQALVIADIDPVFSLEGKPRPQMLPPPLQLVAHLPIFEQWSLSSPGKNDPSACRCEGARKQKRNEFPKQLNSVLASMRGTMSDHQRDVALAIGLSKLAEVNHANRHWLKQRSDAFAAEHIANPQAWPPPVATDWIWVDLNDQDSYDELEIPPYSRLDGDGNGPRSQS